MKTLVNSLTIGRLIATFFLPFIWGVFDSWFILIVVALVLLTDFFDGFLARKYKVQTLFGSIADQIADKMFGIMVIVIISKYYKVFMLLVICEIIIAIVNVTAALKGAHTKSSFLGRVKMWIIGLATMNGLLAIFTNDILSIIKIESIFEAIKYFDLNQEIIINTSVLVTTGAEIMVVIDYISRIKKDLKNNNSKVKYKFKKWEVLNKILFNTDYYLNHKKNTLVEHFFEL